MMAFKRAQTGFTLVEIAIVLVIIGLLLGGVLKGQELIKNARVKAYKQQVDSIVAAYNGYLDRYKALPGDDPNAVARLNNPTGACATCQNGNGNGLIEGAWNSTVLNVETNQFFMHLAAAGFIKANANATTAQELKPKGPNGEVLGVGNNLNGAPGLSVCFQNTNGEMAELVDLAYDDGRPGTGSWRVNNNASQNNYAALGPNYKTTTFNLCSQL